MDRAPDCSPEIPGSIPSHPRFKPGILKEEEEKEVSFTVVTDVEKMAI